MKIFAPFIWLGRKLKADFDAAMNDFENETDQDWIDRQW